MSFLETVATMVSMLKPGERITLDRSTLSSEVGSFEHNGAQFTSADRVLENVIGSGYTHSYFIDWANDRITFVRHADDDPAPRYQSPDRRAASR